MYPFYRVWFGLSVYLRPTKERPATLRAAAVEALISHWLPYQAAEPLPESAPTEQVLRGSGNLLARRICVEGVP